MKQQTRVVVVDDKRPLAQVIGDLLRVLDVEVIGVFTNPRDAVTLAEEDDFDVLLSDIEMPAMTGIELAEKVCQLKPDVRVILMSGNEKFQTEVEARGWKFLRKPLELPTLMEYIDPHPIPTT